MPAPTNGGDQAISTNSHKSLSLKSPYGSLTKVYDWPLKRGRGSLRKSEDKEDEAAEIMETIKYVCEDHPEVLEVMTNCGLMTKGNPESFDYMQNLCNSYNKAVDKMISSKGLQSLKTRMSRANRPHLKHIMQQCYNKSVDDPNELNHYEPFTPEVYGETSFDLICQILDRLHPIPEDNKFIDLGSGVGQVVLQVSALTDCALSLGIEKAKAPSKFAREMITNFEFWMSFYGKTYSKFNLVEGDFLEQKFREDILASTIIFVNNFAFGPEVDQRLKDIFADLADGSRIFSSKSFCALNFRITDRNLSDIGTIMHVSKMDPLKGSVSWTGKPVSYYLHIIDRAKLERFFQKSAARKEGEESKRGRRSGRNPNAIAHLDESSSGSRDDSRASSIEQDEPVTSARPWKSEPVTRNGSDEEAPATSASPLESKLQVPSLRPNTRRKGRRLLLKKRRLVTPHIQVELSSGHQTDSNSSTPPLSGSDASTVSNATSVTRPVRAVVANAAAISVAQQDVNQVTKANRGRQKKSESTVTVPLPEVSPTSSNSSTSAGRKKIVRSQPIPSANALSLLHNVTMESINASNNDITAPSGCVNVRLQIDTTPELNHEELPVSLNTDDEGKEIPIELRMHLEKIKKEYLRFIDRMQTAEFRENILQELNSENKKKIEFQKREKQLNSQISNLVGDSLALLKRRLDELGIKAKTPPEFIEKAKMIVCNHHDLQRNKSSLEAEIIKLEQAQAQMIVKKEKELVEQAMRSSGISSAEAKSLVRRKIDATVSNKAIHHDSKGNPILGLSSEVIVTKCSADQLPPSTQIRKRPREGVGKQKDWPEKRLKDTVTTSPIKSAQAGPDFPQERIDEKNPEALAKKIIEQGRNLERSKTMMSPVGMNSRPTSSVEVRKIEAPVSIQQHQSMGYKSGPPGQPHPPQAHEGARYDHRQMHSNMQVDLPKMDLSMSMVNAGMGALNEPPLVLPPHPPSRSASSDPNEDMTFASTKMSSTPRAGQFEDRLKTIIHSVLAGDEHQDIKPPLNLPMRSSSSPPTQQRPVFSPVKKELPNHLPPPPSGVVITATSMPAYHPREMGSPVKRPTDLSAYPQTASSRTITDLISNEIERSLTGNGPPEQKGYHPDYRGQGPFGGLPGKLRPPSPGSQASGMARMSQVIEDSIRGNFDRVGGHRPPGATKDLEGLACPRSKGPYGRPDSYGHQNRPSNNSPHDYPVEGLAARFGTQRAHWPPPQGGPGQVPQEAGGYRHPPYGHPYPDSYPMKRSPPQMSPVLPPKKQHFDDYRGPKDLGYYHGYAHTPPGREDPRRSDNRAPPLNLSTNQNSQPWSHPPQQQQQQQHKS